jgi:hypothetical protein
MVEAFRRQHARGIQNYCSVETKQYQAKFAKQTFTLVNDEPILAGVADEREAAVTIRDTLVIDLLCLNSEDSSFEAE